MSQFYQGVTAGSLPPSVATSYYTDDGNFATPASNRLNVYTPGSGTQGVATSSSGDTITITVSETSYIGTATTSPAFLVQDLTFPAPFTLAENTSMSIKANIIGRNIATGSSVGGEILATFTRSAGSASLAGAPDTTINRSISLPNATFTALTSGSTILIRVTGQTGTTMNWKGSVDTITVT